MKVLIVEDNEFNRMVMSEMLEILLPGSEIQVHESAAKSLLEGGYDAYDMILSDIDMPEMDGFEFYTRLRKEFGVKVPIIAVTALAVAGDRERILMHGFDAYVSKPINMQEFGETLSQFVKGS